MLVYLTFAVNKQLTYLTVCLSKLWSNLTYTVLEDRGINNSILTVEVFLLDMWNLCIGVSTVLLNNVNEFVFGSLYYFD